MEHTDAIRMGAVEKYLLRELTPEMRDQFEEHYFGCEICSQDLCATATFLDVAKSELKAHPLPQSRATSGRKAPRLFLWTPAFLVPALAALLLVVAYQNIVVLPRVSSEVAELRNAEVLPSISLVGSNSRGGGTHSIIAQAGRPFLLLVDIPGEDRFTSYTCEVVSPAGKVASQVDVTPQQAKDTVSIRVPGVREPGGTYTLVVRGNLNDTHTTSELARYHFVLQTHG